MCHCSFYSLQLKTSALSPTSRKSCVLLSAGTSCREKLLSQPSPPRPHQQHTFQASSFRALFLGWAPFSGFPPPPPLLSGKTSARPASSLGTPTSSSSSSRSSFLWLRLSQTLWLRGTPSTCTKTLHRGFAFFKTSAQPKQLRHWGNTCNACHPPCHRQHGHPSWLRRGCHWGLWHSLMSLRIHVSCRTTLREDDIIFFFLQTRSVVLLKRRCPVVCRGHQNFKWSQ